MARLVMIEDDDVFADMAKEWLEAAGHMVSVVETGEDALDAVLASNPDLLILDHNLPGQSGMSVLGQVRELPHTTGLPILMLTGKSGNLLLARAHRDGADDYVTKPVTPERLLRAVEALVVGANLARRVAHAPLQG